MLTYLGLAFGGGVVTGLLLCVAGRWVGAGGLMPPVNPLPSLLPHPAPDSRGMLDLYLREWQVVIQTQMHFNDLIIRFRSFALTSFVALAGAAVTIANATGLDGPGRVALLVLPVIFWLAALLIDLFYYHALLLGSVAQAAKFDDAPLLKAYGLVGLTQCIRNHATPRRSRAMVVLFYLVPLVAGVAIAVLVTYYGMATPTRSATT